MMEHDHQCVLGEKVSVVLENVVVYGRCGGASLRWLSIVLRRWRGGLIGRASRRGKALSRACAWHD